MAIAVTHQPVICANRDVRVSSLNDTNSALIALAIALFLYLSFIMPFNPNDSKAAGLWHRQSGRLLGPENQTQRFLLCQAAGQSHQRPPDFQIDAGELVSHRMEVMVAAKSIGLGNRGSINQFARCAISRYRHHPSLQWVWRMHRLRPEFWRTTTIHTHLPRTR